LGHRGSEPNFNLEDLNSPENGHQRFATPLPQVLFERPVVEFYQEAFLTIYLRAATLRTSELTDKSMVWLNRLIGAAAGALISETADLVFPRVVERKLVRRHLLWERSPLNARTAKIRDGFTCMVCGFNFGSFYGNIGRGFAEAHHKRPLAFFRTRQVRRSPDDLITVCANCHGLLHKMSGKKSDIARLRRVVRKRSV
jgi:5-methylcytosine-specific restriction endonuclease McrA